MGWPSGAAEDRNIEFIGSSAGVKVAWRSPFGTTEDRNLVPDLLRSQLLQAAVAPSMTEDRKHRAEYRR